MNLRSRWQSVAPGVSPGIMQRYKTEPALAGGRKRRRSLLYEKEPLTVRQSLTAHRGGKAANTWRL